MKEIEDDHLRKHEKYFWVLDPDRGSATSNKPGFVLDEGKMKIFRKRLLSLRRDLVRAGQKALRNEIIERFANDGLLQGDQPLQSFNEVERIIGGGDMRAL